MQLDLRTSALREGLDRDAEQQQALEEEEGKAPAPPAAAASAGCVEEDETGPTASAPHAHTSSGGGNSGGSSNNLRRFLSLADLDSLRSFLLDHQVFGSITGATSSLRQAFEVGEPSACRLPGWLDSSLLLDAGLGLLLFFAGHTPDVSHPPPTNTPQHRSTPCARCSTRWRCPSPRSSCTSTRSASWPMHSACMPALVGRCGYVQTPHSVSHFHCCISLPPLPPRRRSGRYQDLIAVETTVLVAVTDRHLYVIDPSFAAPNPRSACLTGVNAAANCTARVRCMITHIIGLTRTNRHPAYLPQRAHEALLRGVAAAASGPPSAACVGPCRRGLPGAVGPVSPRDVVYTYSPRIDSCPSL